ncbi:MAG: cysteine desulfurase NifS [Candidatus Latescibacteria bacterium]|nr:cysteine desulfurase NifS [Candidatus Latescibacterota bacterium]
MRRIYLDHNATTPVRPEVLEAMLPFFRERFGNASSIHAFGQAARAPVEEARAQAARLLGARPGEVFFTSGGTESDNLAIKGVAYANRGRGSHIITSQIEHHAVLNSCQFLEQEGFTVTYLPVDSDGLVDPDDVARTITDRTILVSIMHANNEIGTIQPVEEIGRIARERGVFFHTDAVQSAGKLPIEVDAMYIDLLSISGHKLYGPKGVGAVYIRKGTQIVQTAHGGHHEGDVRAGTENTPGIVGLGKAAELAFIEREAEAQHLTQLRDLLQRRLLDEIDDIRVNGHPTRRLPGTLNVSFTAAEGESLILSLDLKGIAVSSGSACTSGSLEPSHVLLALGLDPQLAQTSVRFSFGRDNTREDVEDVMEHLPEIVARLRAMSALTVKQEKIRGSGFGVRG